MYSCGPPTHGCARVGRPARTYIQQLCEDTGCNPEDLPEAMNDRGEMARDGQGYPREAARHDDDDDGKIAFTFKTQIVYSSDFTKKI